MPAVALHRRSKENHVNHAKIAYQINIFPVEKIIMISRGYRYEREQDKERGTLVRDHRRRTWYEWRRGKRLYL